MTTCAAAKDQLSRNALKRSEDLQAENEATAASYRAMDAKRQRLMSENDAPASSMRALAKPIEPSRSPGFGAEVEREQEDEQANDTRHDGPDDMGPEVFGPVSLMRLKFQTLTHCCFSSLQHTTGALSPPPEDDTSRRGRIRRKALFYDEIHPPEALTRTRATARPSEPSIESERLRLVPVKTTSDAFGRFRIFADTSSPVEFIAREPNYDKHMDIPVDNDPLSSYMDRLLHPFASISDLLWTLHFFSSSRNSLAHHHRGIDLMQREDFRPQDLNHMPQVVVVQLKSLLI